MTAIQCIFLSSDNMGFLDGEVHDGAIRDFQDLTAEVLLMEDQPVPDMCSCLRSDSTYRIGRMML